MLNRLRTESEDWLHLDMLRFVASAGIVWHHSHEFLYPKAMRASLATTMGFALFVDLFFVISGFIISAVYAHRMTDLGQYGRFMQRRFGRLLPLFWAIFGLMLIIWVIAVKMHLHVSNMPDLSAACIANNALLLNGFIPCGSGPQILGVSWSISIELVMYAIFPLLLLLIRTRVMSLIVLGCMGAVFGFLFIRVSPNVSDFPPILRGLMSFSLGMVAYKERDLLTKLALPSYVMLIVLGMAIAAMDLGAPQLVTLLLVWMCVTLAICADLGGKASPLVHKIAPFGQLTYSIYLWHPLIILLIINVIGDKFLKLSSLYMTILLLFTYILIMIQSFFSLFTYETPLRKFIDSLNLSKLRLLLSANRG